MPKRPLNPFIAFVQINSPKYAEKGTPDGVTPMKLCGEAWSKMSDKEKQKYVDISEKDKARYEHEIEEFKKKGSFTNS